MGLTEGMEWGGTSEKRCEWMTGKDEEVEMGERGRGRIKRDRGDYLLPLLNFNSLMTSGCFFNQMISSSSNSSSWFPYISPTPVRSQSRFTLKAEDMLLMSRFDGDIVILVFFAHELYDAHAGGSFEGSYADRRRVGLGAAQKQRRDKAKSKSEGNQFFHDKILIGNYYLMSDR